jgi:hypothetical protein
MNTFKVTNITDRLGKRHPNYNSTLNVSYVDQMERKSLLLEPKKTIYFSAASLPLSLHRFRMKNLVSVSEITEQELLKLKNEPTKNEAKKEKKSTPKKKTVSKSSSEKTESESTKPKRTYTKKTTTAKKETEESK